jgi:hypothetical protein
MPKAAAVLEDGYNQYDIFKCFDADFGRTVLRKLAEPSIRQPSARPQTDDLKRATVSQKVDPVPPYLVSEVEYIRTFGY